MPRKQTAVEENSSSNATDRQTSGRSGWLWLALFVLLLNGSWAVYHIQYETLPQPLSPEEAGKRGFSEISAMEHVKYLAALGPHPVGSEALDRAVQYVLTVSENIKETAHWEVDVQVDLFHSKIGVNQLVGGSFKGKTLIYSDLKHVVLRILPKYLSEAEESAILVSSHIDTVFSAEGAGDCSSCISVMLELARGISQWAHGFKNGVIFLFNTGEEEGLNGAHSFITQHPWRTAIKFMVDLESMGIGGKSLLFQTSLAPWAVETYARVVKYPSAQVIAQDYFLSGALNSATDFQVYKEVANLPGLDFGYIAAGAVYHTKNDKLKLLKPGSLQHLGENMLAFLLHTAVIPNLQKVVAIEAQGDTGVIFFDVLGKSMIVYRQRIANMLQNSVILQAFLLLATSIHMGGFLGLKSFGLSCLSIILMWTFSLSSSALVAFVLHHIYCFPIPYIANPWLIIGLFGAPALLGALGGQHVAFILLQKSFQQTILIRAGNLPSNVQANLVKCEAERLLYKAGLIQWFVILFLCNHFKLGSSYLALVWLVSPAFAYGLMEATLTPTRAPRQMKVTTLILGLFIPCLITSGVVISFLGAIVASIVHFDRNPGSSLQLIGNLIIPVLVASIVCLTFVYLISYFHLSGSKRPIIIFLCTLFGITLIAVLSGAIPAFTQDIARTVNVVHVVESAGRHSDNQKPVSFVSIFSGTPGKLEMEMKNLKDEFICGRNMTVDFVSFSVKYGCQSSKNSENGWDQSDIPLIGVESDTITNERRTSIFLDTKSSTRWTLAINGEEIRDFTFEVDSDEVVPEGGKSMVKGWHIIQFSGGKDSPTKFHMNLFWLRNSTHQLESHKLGTDIPLLKLRTDVDRITPVTAMVLEKLPPWCSPFGKSTSPYTLAFLTSLPVNFGHTAAAY